MEKLNYCKTREQITVKELCEISVIHSFYLRYNSIYDLLSEILEDMSFRIS